MTAAWPVRTKLVEIRDAAGLSPDELKQRYVSTSTPVIVRGFIPPEVCRAADPRALARDSGEEKINVLVDIPRQFLADFELKNRRVMTIAKFVEFLDAPQRKLPCYANQQPIERFGKLASTLSYEPLLPGVKPKLVWFSSAGANIGLHFDAADGFLAQLWGRKTFYFLPHEDSGSIYPLEEDVTRSQVDLRSVDLRKFPKMAGLTPYVGTLEAGDLVFIPKYMWHYFWGLTTSVSTSIFTPPDFTPARLASLLRMYGPQYSMGVAQQTIKYGLLGRPYTPRGYGWPPFGLLLFRMMQGKPPIPETTSDSSGFAKGETIGFAKGEAAGLSRALLGILAARNIPVSEEIRGRIEGCKDPRVLERWIVRASTATSADVLTAGAKKAPVEA